ncbi:OLC1v1036705C1 [Oldenlandia corymbosa var. corymbosa]|uniref:Riboflavin biosynthesis protein PYRD, chloroplastic n=1 Tax=Oldenlandia corymbosa var. corymbosa TaxID=529605 RepID=A0AAV1CVZ2_OLDCO|nr:OLC1v1036705C1 [Oldenlandia corymbosa var. corymbosa]
MYLQAPPTSNHILRPPKFVLGTHFVNPCPQIYQLKRIDSNPKLKSGFFDSTKRVSISQVGLVKCGGLVGVRCEAGHDDGYYIRRCVELARKAIGFTSPNPMVGCVIVKDGKIVGEGFHPKAGQPHAEVFALRAAGNLADGATAYVSLEPCNHFGRTPPCSEALIKARVKKVVVGMVDPNPIVASRGIEKLRNAGIEVIVGVEEELCKKLNEAWIHQMLTGKPFVTLRYSMSVNGHVVNQLGTTVLQSGGYYSKLLQEYDAVISSSSLFLEGLPLPTSKEPGANQPVQIVLAKASARPTDVPTFPNESASEFIIFTEEETSWQQEAAKIGAKMVVSGRMTLLSILECCKQQGLCSVLLDLRGNIIDFEGILREADELNLFQKYVVEVLPVWDGSTEDLLTSIPVNLKVENLSSAVSDETILLEGYFVNKAESS